jgi:hypothetical protein
VPQPRPHRAGGEGARVRRAGTRPLYFISETDFVNRDPTCRISHTSYTISHTSHTVSHTSYKICQPSVFRASVRAHCRSVRVIDGSVRANFDSRSVTDGRCVPNRERCGLFSRQYGLRRGGARQITDSARQIGGGAGKSASVRAKIGACREWDVCGAGSRGRVWRLLRRGKFLCVRGAGCAYNAAPDEQGRRGVRTGAVRLRAGVAQNSRPFNLAHGPEPLIL